ncbi:MAG TPA: hypothetical protein VEG32_12100 [Clostridia bacterium]|nr:hypothetical protein [Clostridia bacterium]
MSSLPMSVVPASQPDKNPSLQQSAAEARARLQQLRATLGKVAWQMSTAAELPEQRLPEMVTSGVAELDRLTGGLPRGAVTEIAGAASTGRTSVMVACMAAATARGEVCALIDTSDSFDPESAATSGVQLDRVLWVRCNGALPQKQDTAPRFTANDFGGHDFVEKPEKKNSRWEQRNRPLYARLEQALRAADLLLHGGGFGLIAFDMADLPVEVARRVPMTTWFRFRRAVENTPTSLIVVQSEGLAATCASLAVRVARRDIGRHIVEAPSAANLLRGLEITAEIVRSPQERSRKKPVQRETSIRVEHSAVRWS